MTSVVDGSHNRGVVPYTEEVAETHSCSPNPRHVAFFRPVPLVLVYSLGISVQ